MLITDAIDAARTEHEIFFLLTAYIDALGHGLAPGSLPEPLLALPVRGRADLQRRTAVLGSQLDDALPTQAEAREAFSILITALLALERVATEQSACLDELQIGKGVPAWLSGSAQEPRGEQENTL